MPSLSFKLSIYNDLIQSAIQYGTKIIFAILIFAIGIGLAKFIVKIIDRLFLIRKIEDTIRV